MKFKDALGIDVSKKTIDVFLQSKQLHCKFNNTTKGFKELIKWIVIKAECNFEQVIICFEHTGLYSLPLAIFLTDIKKEFAMVPALEIKRSLGIVRGKDDKVDARRIAEYAFLRKEALKPYALPSKDILQLQKLLSLRTKMVKQCAGYKSELTENKELCKQSDYTFFFSAQKKMIQYLNKQIASIEKEALTLIKKDLKMNELYLLITSVKGVGFVIASTILVITDCFQRFDDSRKFACYSGIAPFEHQSGTSVRGRTKVSQLANKKMKALLNNAATSAIQCDPEMRIFYQRRLELGKSKMSTLNIVRNKIIHRIFAVVKRGTPYVILNKYAA